MDPEGAKLGSCRALSRYYWSFELIREGSQDKPVRKCWRSLCGVMEASARPCVGAVGYGTGAAGTRARCTEGRAWGR